MWKKVERVSLSEGVGCSGYLNVMVWRNFQVARPSSALGGEKKGNREKTEMDTLIQ